MTEPELTIEKDGRVTVIAINRPANNNTLNDAVLTQLRRSVSELETDGTRAVVIKGAGGVFSGGFDVSGKRPRSPAEMRDHADLASDTFWRIWRSPLPYVAAAERYCLGGAVYFSGVCDFMVTSPSAEIGMFELRLGMAPPLFNLFPWMLGYRVAKQFLFTGDIVDGRRALEWGLASHCVADGQVIAESLKLAHRLAGMPDKVIATLKRSVNRRWELAGMVAGIEEDVEQFVRDKIDMGPIQREFRRLARDHGVAEAISRMGIELGLREQYRQ